LKKLGTSALEFEVKEKSERLKEGKLLNKEIQRVKINVCKIIKSKLEKRKIIVLKLNNYGYTLTVLF
jgi:hypothetical protein